MKILCRIAEPTDLREILQVQELSIRMLHPPSTKKETLEALISNQNQSRNLSEEFILLATCNHEIVGFIAFLLNKSLITGLYIHPDFTRQGIATELVALAQELLETKKRRNIYVLSSEYGKSFYKTCGFQVIYSRYMVLERHKKIRVFWMRKSLYTPTVSEQKRNMIALGILSIIFAISLWIAFSGSS